MTQIPACRPTAVESVWLHIPETLANPFETQPFRGARFALSATCTVFFLTRFGFLAAFFVPKILSKFSENASDDPVCTV